MANMDERKSIELFTPEIEALVAEMNRPIVLPAASGEWITARQAISIVAEICAVDQDEAIKSICRRAVILVPVSPCTSTRYECPHEYINRYDWLKERKRPNSHFKQTLDYQSFYEILHFFEEIENFVDHTNESPIDYASWGTGDFKICLQRDFSDVTLTVVGLRFDPVALASAFGGPKNAGFLPRVGLARKAGGRPGSPAWPSWIAELVHHIHENGFPAGEGSQGQEALINAVADKLAAKGLAAPSRATVQSAAQAVLDRMRQPDS